MLLQMASFCSFLWLSNIPLYICTTTSLPFLCQWTFRLLPCSGYCKYCAMNLGVHVSFRIMVFSRYMPRSEISASYGRSILVFQGTSILFSIVAAPICIHTNSVGRFPFLYALSSIYCL